MNIRRPNSLVSLIAVLAASLFAGAAVGAETPDRASGPPNAMRREMTGCGQNTPSECLRFRALHQLLVANDGAAAHNLQELGFRLALDEIEQKRPTQALAILDQIEPALRQWWSGTPSHPALAGVHAARAEALVAMGDRQGATDAFNKALAVARTEANPQNPEPAWRVRALLRVAASAARLNLPDTAASLLVEASSSSSAMAVAEAMSADRHKSSALADVRDGIVDAFLRTGRHDDAVLAAVRFDAPFRAPATTGEEASVGAAATLRWLSGSALLHLAQEVAEMGDMGRARAIWQEAKRQAEEPPAERMPTEGFLALGANRTWKSLVILASIDPAAALAALNDAPLPARLKSHVAVAASRAWLKRRQADHALAALEKALQDDRLRESIHVIITMRDDYGTEEARRRLLALRVEAESLDDLDGAQIPAALGSALASLGDARNAEPLLRTAIRRVKALPFNDGHPMRGQPTMLQAWLALARLGDPEAKDKLLQSMDGGRLAIQFSQDDRVDDAAAILRDKQGALLARAEERRIPIEVMNLIHGWSSIALLHDKAGRSTDADAAFAAAIAAVDLYSARTWRDQNGPIRSAVREVIDLSGRLAATGRRDAALRLLAQAEGKLQQSVTGLERVAIMKAQARLGAREHIEETSRRLREEGVAFFSTPDWRTKGLVSIEPNEDRLINAVLLWAAAGDVDRALAEARAIAAPASAMVPAPELRARRGEALGRVARHLAACGKREQVEKASAAIQQRELEAAVLVEQALGDSARARADILTKALETLQQMSADPRAAVPLASAAIRLARAEHRADAAEQVAAQAISYAASHGSARERITALSRLAVEFAKASEPDHARAALDQFNELAKTIAASLDDMSRIAAMRIAVHTLLQQSAMAVDEFNALDASHAKLSHPLSAAHLALLAHSFDEPRPTGPETCDTASSALITGPSGGDTPQQEPRDEDPQRGPSAAPPARPVPTPPRPSSAAAPNPSSAPFSRPAGATPDACALSSMPSDAQIHAVTIYQAPKKTTVQIDKHGFETRQADIVVTALDRPIALVLSAHEPVVWNLLLHPKAKIAGVIVTGTHAQALVGLPQHTPSIIASDLGATPSCARAFPPAPHNGRDLGELARAVTHATGKPVDAVHTAPTDKRFIIGPAHLLQDVPRPPPGPAVPAGYDTVNSILGGKAGLQLAIERGDIRRATQADLAAWIDGAARATQHSKETIDRLNPHNTWVIVRDVRVPPGLHGISYILPSGVSVFGEGGLGTYYRMDDFTCRSGHPIGNRC